MLRAQIMIKEKKEQNDVSLIESLKLRSRGAAVTSIHKTT